MQSERINIRRIITYFAFLLLVYILQTSIGSTITIMGYKIDLIPCIVASVALMSGYVEAGIIGFIAGILYDTSYSAIEGLMPAYYMLFGIVASVLSAKYLRKMLPAAWILIISSMALCNTIRYVFYLYMFEKVEFLLFFKGMCAEVLIAIILSPFIYYSIKSINKKLK